MIVNTTMRPRRSCKDVIYHSRVPQARPRSSLHRWLGPALPLLLLLATLAACAPAAAPPPPKPAPAASAPTTAPAGGAAALAPPAPPATPAPPQRLRVAWVALGGGFLPLHTAKERGFFDTRGLDAELVFTTGPQAVQSLIAREVDVAYVDAAQHVRASL